MKNCLRLTAGWLQTWMDGFILILGLTSMWMTAVDGGGCQGRVLGTTWVPIVRNTCKPREAQGSCMSDGKIMFETDFAHRGSELNDGRSTPTVSDEDCCTKCRKTPGCRVWTRFQVNAPHNDEGVCWLKSSAPKPSQGKVQLTGGIIAPPVENPSSCRQRNGIGIVNMVAYNHPDLLVTEEWETCCHWCQDDNEFCRGWMWLRTNGSCLLYGNSVGESEMQLCAECVSGTRKAARDLVMNAVHCKHGGGRNVKYIGSPRVILAPAGAFQTETSKECCGLCAAIKDCRSWSWTMPQCILNSDIPASVPDSQYFGGVANPTVCNPEACDSVSGVYMDESDLYCSQESAPSENFLIVESQEECCLRCQQFPECKAWSFVRGIRGRANSACSLKLIVPYAHNYISTNGIGSGHAWSGIITSRLEANEIQKFHNRIKAVREGVSVTGEQISVSSKGRGVSDTWVIVGSIIGGLASLMLCVILCSILALVRSSHKRKAYNKNILKQGVELTDSQPCGSRGQSPQVTSPSPFMSGAEVFGGTPVRSYRRLDIETSIPQKPMTPDVSERRFNYLRQRIDEMKGPQGRFSTSMDHYGDVAWLKFNAEMSRVEPGTELGGKYIIEFGIHMGDNSVVLNARQKFSGPLSVVMKFFRRQKSCSAELSFYQQQLEAAYIPQVFDFFDGDTVHSWGLPPVPCIVMERGNSTLAEWLQRPSHTIDQMDQRNILFKICKATGGLHDLGIVHRDLKPDNIVIFSDTLSWKLIDFGSWAKKGSSAELEYTLRYAAPELLVAHATDDNIFITPSMDMWSLGVIFWEVLTGDPLFGQEYSNEQVMSMLMGVEELPFQKHSEMWQQIEHPAARRLVENLLQDNPTKRWNIHKVLRNAFFMSAPDTIQLRQSHAEYANTLKTLVSAVEQVDTKVEQVKNIGIENLKNTVGNILITCFSFYELSPKEFIQRTPTDAEIAEMYINNSLKSTKVPVEPSYNVFKRAKEEPAMLLRLERNYLVKITLISGGTSAMDLPISEIAFARICPAGSEDDFQEMKVFNVFHKGHLMEGVGLWNMTDHRDVCLRLIGNTRIVICVGLKIKGSPGITEVRKTIDLRLYPPSENFRVVKQFIRTKEWYANLPPWAKIYIHGAVSVVSLGCKVLL